jgi:hypothetical protein
MKPARLLLVILGLVAVVCGVTLSLALTPAIQRWALLRAVHSTPGLRLEVGSVSVGLSSIILRDVQVQKSGLGIKLDRLDSDYSLFQLAFSRQLQIRHLTVSGLVVDASRLSSARSKTTAVVAGAPAVASGLLTQIQLPVVLVLDDIRIDGRALLPGAPGQPLLETEYKITGGKIAPGQEGTLLFTSVLKNPAADARVAALNAQVSLRVKQTDQKTFDHVSLTAVVDAEGRNFSDQSQLKISAEVGRNSSGETYTCRIDTLQRGTAGQVLALSASLPADRKEYAGEWTLQARSDQLEPFCLGAVLPDFNAHGDGRFTFNPSTRAISLSGHIEADVSRLEVIEPAWRAIGAVRLQTQFDLAEAEGIARLRQLEVKLAGEHPVFELRATQAAEFNLRERRLQVGGTAPGEVLQLSVSGLPVAWVRPFVHGLDVSGGKITGQFTVSAEKDRLLVRSLVPLQLDTISVVQDGRLLLDKATISLNLEASLAGKELQAKVSAFTLATPAGDSITAQAGISLPVTPNPAIAVTASFAADLPKLLAPWSPLGRIKAAGETDFTLTGANLELRRLHAKVTDGAGLTLFKAEALQPFTLDVAARRAAPAGKSVVELARIELGHIPLDRLPLNQPGAKLGGAVEQGTFVLTADADKLTVRATAPLKLTDVSLTQDGQPALAGLSVEAQPSVEVTGHSAAKGETGDVTVRSANGAVLLTLKGEASRSAEAGLRGTMTFNLEVPQLATQPLFAGAQVVSQGRASGEIRAALGATNQVEARLTFNGLVSREGGQTLPVANLSFRAVAQADGKLSVQVPLLLDRSGQRSDLNFALELAPAGGVFALDGKLTGEHVELADALSLLGVFMDSAAPGGKAAPAVAIPVKVTADTVPSWSHFTGRLALDIKSVTRGAEWSMTGLTGLVNITRDRVSLDKLQAAFSEKSRLAAKGDLKFSQGAQPYQLGGEYSLTEFDAGRLFKALDPGKAPTVEGTFTVNGHLAGTGETLDRAMERTRGQLELTSRQGIFRGLQRTSNRVSITSKAVELGASMLGTLLGAQKATKAAEKVAGTAYFVDQLAQSVAELNYDQLNVRLVRDESLNMRLEDFSLVAPEIRLLGKGDVTYVADKPLLEQPLNVSLSLAGRGKIEQILGKLRLLDGTRDELGYAKTSQPITVTGSLAKPDPSAFFTKIAASKLTDFLTPDN